MNFKELLADNNEKTQEISRLKHIVGNLQDYVEVVRADTLRKFHETLTAAGPCSQFTPAKAQYTLVLNSLIASAEILEEKANCKQVKS